MPLHKALMGCGFKLPRCEKHFHDHDETWLILKGKGSGYLIEHAGQRTECVLEAGDVWMIPAGCEHGSTGPNSDDFEISVLNGTQPPGAHKPGHYYVEQEGYLPSLELKKTPTDRYKGTAPRPSVMKGIIFSEKGKAILREEPKPICQPYNLLCQTLYTGLTNGTERNVLLGGNYGKPWPCRCGYQNVGRVLEVGLGVKNFATGDLVFSGDFCQHTEFFTAPANHDSLLVKLPCELPLNEAALLGIASVALHDVRRAAVKLGDRALIVGAGLIGLFTAQAACAAGAIVTICDLDEKRLAIARHLGVHGALVPDKDWANVRAMGPYDSIIEDSGAPVLDHLIGLLKPRGTLALIAGRSRVDYSFNLGQWSEITVVQAGHFATDDLRQVLRLVLEGKIKIAPLIQDVVAVTEAPGIYDRLRDEPGSLLGTVFDWCGPS